MSTEHKEYIVTVHRASDLDDIYNELENSGCGCHGHFPERAVECLNRRPISRNTHYLLTEEEAAMIAADPRVLAVELNPADQGIEIGYDWTETSNNFVRNGVTSSSHRNWGLLRVWNGSNLPNWGIDGTPTYAGTVTVYASGTNVDVVIIDGHMNPSHPEYAVNSDGTGGTRVNQYNWFQLNPLVTGGSTSTYVYTPYTGSGAEGDNNHGAHVAGTVAGNTQGWARNATIYNISPYGSNPNGNLSNVFDYVRAFHATKPVNPLTGVKNPTITSNSWGYRIGFVSASSITSVNYRGTTYTTSTSFTDAQLQSWNIPSFGGGISAQTVRVPSVDADIEDAVAAGVIVVASAGNSYAFMDSQGGLDYNNSYFSSSVGTVYYARGATPGAANGSICVGSIDIYKNDRKSTFSNCGPRVDIFAPGSAIISSTNSGGIGDPRGSGFLAKYSGTSMSSPQVVGVLALVLGKYPTWTTTNIVSYFPNVYSVGQIATTFGGTADFTDLQNAPNRFLKVPAELLTNSSQFTATLVTSFIELTKDYPATPFAPVSASGGTSPYTWAISPSLITGLSFNTSTGYVSGTPTATLSSSSYTITVTDSAASSYNKVFSVAVATTLTTVSLIGSVTLTKDQAMSPVTPVSASGGTLPITWSNSPGSTFSSLGLSLNPTTGIISGTPTSLLNTTTFNIKATDSVGRQSYQPFDIRVVSNVQPLVLTNPVPLISVPAFGNITPVTPVQATGGVAPYVFNISPAVPLGVTYNTSTGVISGTPVNLLSTTTYAVTVRDSNVPTQAVATATFGLHVYAIPLVLTANVSTATNIIFQPITPFAPVTASGGSGTKTWAINPQLPQGVSFNTTNGFISGTPTVQSPLISYTITVTDQTGQTSNRSFSFKILVPLLVTTVEVAKILFYPGTTITPFTPVSVSGGAGVSTLSISPALPQGLTFNTSTGVISGTPTVNGRSNTYVITATDQAGQTSSKTFKLKIKSRLDVIDADDQNIVYDKLFSLMGTTVTGYGANTASKPVNYGQIVRDEDWDYMYDDIVRVKIHQYGTATNNLLVADPNQIVLDGVQDRIYTWAQLHLATSSTVHPSQLSSMSINTNEASPPEWISDNDDPSEWTDITGNGYIAAAGFTWFRPAQLNYFFNLGGSITPKITLGAGTIRDLLAWDTLVEEANQIVFSKDEFYTALNSPSKSFIHIITGPGNFDPNNKKKNVKYKKTKTYAANGIIIKFQIVDSRILASIQFVAGNGKKKKKGKGKGKNKKANYIVVRLQINTDFITEYSNANTGGIAAPIPQTQLINNCLSIDTRPVDPFTFAIGNESETRSIELRNNSTQTCNITDIFLTSYTQGIVSPTTLTIPPHSSSYINLKYTGNTAGLYKGYVNIESNINNFTIFTQVEVGSISPPSLILTTGTTDIINQDFTVDLVGGPYERFDAVLEPNGNGFTFVEHPFAFATEIVDRFNVTFNPALKPNGLYSTTATVTVYPLDNNNEVAVFEVPIEINLDVKRYNIGRWISALGHQTSALGLSFDYIEGKRYLTIGVGTNGPLLSELGTIDTFNSWSEVYRIIIEDRFETLYSSNHVVKQTTDYASNFGVGKALGSMITVKNLKYGNIEIYLNSLRYPGDNDTTSKILKGLAQAFYYYDPTAFRVTQLETVNQLTNEGCTRYFKTFDKDGTVETTLVVPNRDS